MKGQRELTSKFGGCRRRIALLPDGACSILTDIRDTKAALLLGLRSVETETGWLDPTGQTGQQIWSSVEVLDALLRVNALPENYRGALQYVAQRKRADDCQSGWEHEGINGHISTCVTSAVLKLYLSARLFDQAVELIESLTGMQNEDGGWGVCPSDPVSKVRSSAFVLSSLLRGMRDSPCRRSVNCEAVTRGIEWLMSARNDTVSDCCWSDMPTTEPSNVSATAHVLDVLLDSLETQPIAQHIPTAQVRHVSSRCIDQMIGMHTDWSWQGVREDVGVEISGRLVGRHTIGGVGGSLVLQVIAKGVEQGLADWPCEALLCGIERMIAQCQTWPSLEGLWVVPAEDGGAPLVWNSAYALNSLDEVDHLLSVHLEGRWIDARAPSELHARARFWRTASVILLAGILGVSVAPHMGALGWIPRWFAQLPPLYQALLMVGVSAGFERLLRVTFFGLRLAWRHRSRGTVGITE